MMRPEQRWGERSISVLSDCFPHLHNHISISTVKLTELLFSPKALFHMILRTPYFIVSFRRDYMRWF